VDAEEKVLGAGDGDGVRSRVGPCGGTGIGNDITVHQSSLCILLFFNLVKTNKVLTPSGTKNEMGRSGVERASSARTASRWRWITSNVKIHSTYHDTTKI
jgi:hypothetical protein